MDRHAYQVCRTIATPIYGKLSDLYGRKRLLQTALAIFGIASILCALAQTMPQLIAARALQGLGGGGLIAMAHATIGDVLAPRDRGRYAGYFAGTFAVSGVMGPVLGGLFTDYLSWRYVFWINLPICLAAWLLAQRALSKLAVRATEREIDYGGAALLISAVVPLLLVASWGGVEVAWASPTIVGLALCGLAFAVLFVLRELAAREAILPPRMFWRREFSMLMCIGFVGPMMTGSTIVMLPLYFQLVTGASASRAGLFLMAMSGGMVVGSFVSGQVIARLGRYKYLPIVGFGLQMTAFSLLAGLSPETPRWMTALFAALVGFGSGTTMSVVTVGAQNAVDPGDLGAASAAGSFFRNLGAAFGVSLLTALLLAQLAANLAAVPGAASLGEDPALEMLRGGSAVIEHLGEAARAQAALAADRAFSTVFRVASFLAMLGVALALGLRGLPLRKTPAGRLTGREDNSAH